MAFHAIAHQDVTPGSTYSWVDKNCDPYIPVGATGVVLRIVNEYASGEVSIGVRKKGSTDNRSTPVYRGTHGWMVIGVDASRVFQAYTTSTTYCKIYLVGYTTSGVTLLTNGVDKTPGSQGSWVDIDCSSEAPSAVALMFEFDYSTGTNFDLGLRKKGSTDNRVNNYVFRTPIGLIIGCDGSQVCQGYVQYTAYESLYLVGYATTGVTMNTNALDRSLGSTGSYVDLTALPANSEWGFYEIISSAAYYDMALRKNGDSDDYYWNAGTHNWFGVACDNGQLVEGKIENTGVDFFEIGWAQGNTMPTAPTGLKCEGQTNPTSVTDLTPEFRATLNDPDSGDILTHVKIQVNTASDFLGTDMWVSDWIDINDVAEGNECADVAYGTGGGATALEQLGITYYWRIKAKDDGGGEGVWSIEEAHFTMAPKPVSVSDTGTGQASIGVASRVSVADAGTGNEGISWIRTLTQTDAGQLINETLGVLVQALIADAGSGVDSSSVTAKISLADAGIGTGTVTVTAEVGPISDSGAGHEALLVTAKISLADAGVGDEAAMLVVNRFTVTDAGTGDDAESITVQFAVTDQGIAQDSVTIHVALPVLSELGIGQDAVAVKVAFSLTETGTSQESVSIKGSVSLLDSGTGNDSIAEVLSQVAITDLGVGAAVVSILAKLGITDLGEGSDLLKLIQSWITVADQGGGEESVSKKNWVPTVGIEVVYPSEAAIQYPEEDDLDYVN